MSQSANYQYRLSAEERERQRLNRVRANAEATADRQRNRLAELETEGHEEHAPAEFASIRSQMQESQRLLVADPDRARDLNEQIGRDLAVLPALARAAKRLAEEQARRRAEERARMVQQTRTWFQARLAEIADPVVRDFAYPELIKLRAGLADLESSDPAAWRIRADAQIGEALRVAGEAAAGWKQTQREATLAKTRNTALQETETAVRAARGVDTKVVQAVLGDLERLAARLDGNASVPQPEFDDALRGHLRAVERAQVDEDCRREVVRQILAALQATGFDVGPPKRQVDGDLDEVVIRARKPSGAKAMFRVALQGSLVHKFDDYEGSACKSDIDKVLEMMQLIYGIQLSDKRVLWENPDRLTADARPLTPGTKEKTHGR